MNYELNFNNVFIRKCGRKAANSQRAVGTIRHCCEKERKAKTV